MIIFFHELFVCALDKTTRTNKFVHATQKYHCENRQSLKLKLMITGGEAQSDGRQIYLNIF